MPPELRLHIYSYLLPLDLDCCDLLGLVLCCRTIKEEVYHEMSKLVRRCSERLQSRWPFNKPFNMSYPARALKTKELVIQVPYYNNGQSCDLSEEIAPTPSERVSKFRQEGAFDVGARRVLLRIVPSPRIETQAPIPFFRLPPIALKQPKDRGELSILLRMYVALTWNNNVQAQFPEQLIIVEYGREHPTSEHAYPSTVLEMHKESTDRCLKVKKLAALPIPREKIG
jgi:hypothetical protein